MNSYAVGRFQIAQNFPYSRKFSWDVIFAEELLRRITEIVWWFNLIFILEGRPQKKRKIKSLIPELSEVLTMKKDMGMFMIYLHPVFI